MRAAASIDACAAESGLAVATLASIAVAGTAFACGAAMWGDGPGPEQLLAIFVFPALLLSALKFGVLFGVAGAGKRTVATWSHLLFAKIGGVVAVYAMAIAFQNRPPALLWAAYSVGHFVVAFPILAASGRRPVLSTFLVSAVIPWLYFGAVEFQQRQLS